ncbi:MAG: zinc-binding dehydrogenase [Bacteriovoracaceae bacterium]|nr:zinc-binding dehydrogenase [Bacteriovoracaceae bacterium]
MKAVVVKKAGGPEVLELVDIDEPQVLKDEIKIRVKAFGLNKAESYYRSGNYGQLVPGQALGIEAVGEVLNDPSGKFRIGQKVGTAMGGMMFARHGGYAEIISVKASNVFSFDGQLSFEELAALPESYLTIWGALDKNLKIAKGESLLVRGGTSAAGLAAISYANARGVEVIATTRNENSFEVLKRAGARYVVIDNGEIVDKVRAIYPSGVDKALEVVGAATVKDTMKCIKVWGSVAVIGLLGGAPVLEKFNLMADLPNTVNLSFFSSGLLGSESLPLAESPLNWIAHQIESKKMPSLLAKVFSIEEIQEAHRLLDSGKAGGKIVVSF